MATPESYTYGHPLSLHDALRILEPDRLTHHVRPVDTRPAGECEPRAAPQPAPRQPGPPSEDRLRQQPHGRLRIRSAEHTSELQSLMRLSSAVFCLNKKNNHKPPKHTPPTHHTHNQPHHIP